MGSFLLNKAVERSRHADNNISSKRRFFIIIIDGSLWASGHFLYWPPGSGMFVLTQLTIGAKPRIFLLDGLTNNNIYSAQINAIRVFIAAIIRQKANLLIV
jgi:hypothetical protein